MSELYTKAKQLLNAEHRNNLAVVEGDPFSQLFMNEKMKHSLQVAGAGNGILKNESYLKIAAPNFLKLPKPRSYCMIFSAFRK